VGHATFAIPESTVDASRKHAIRFQSLETNRVAHPKWALFAFSIESVVEAIAKDAGTLAIAFTSPEYERKKV
jgi:hypothetical protein